MREVSAGLHDPKTFVDLCDAVRTTPGAAKELSLSAGLVILKNLGGRGAMGCLLTAEAAVLCGSAGPLSRATGLKDIIRILDIKIRSKFCQNSGDFARMLKKFSIFGIARHLLECSVKVREILIKIGAKFDEER